ncbi:acetate--CoA ligase alpha subunit [Methanothermococcus okinawensis]|uniref:acetate--CoA ligase (ADP-forming) n=1 Tax=Methanothermococcus okinawensis (strain DSM 14208 / JCM 11175 / IH1) TaxID=647113 RepID=F8ANQ7_METOI|nr:acetate--CoA ligase [Methanothermococcus okinawensis]AEH06255.1 acetyl coenzyme A synthetase (ADP forming), alpha domain protein [Methanothermococcus okinawensis IH1]
MLDKIFNPKSIAVIGASSIEGKVGHAIMKNLMAFGKNNPDNKIYPINPKYDEILGIKCYKSVLDVLPDNIDLAVITIPAKLIPNILEECGKKGIKGAVIISAGFSEVGNYELEEKVKSIAKKYNIRIIGPNCLGIINMHNRLNASFSKEYFKEGNITFISQSGAILTAILDIAPLLNLGFSKIVSLGNKIDIQESDLMEYLIHDDTTEVVVFYIEGLKDKKFIESAKKLAKIKPIIALKSGKTEAGAKAASSHTGSLAGDAQIYNAAFKKGKVLTVETFEELVNLMHVFSTQPLMKSNKIGIITNAGGFGVIAADSCKKYGLTIEEFEESTREELKKYLPPTSSISNPLDLIGDADTDRYKNALNIVKNDKNIDGMLVILTPQEMTKPLEVANVIVETKNKIKNEGIGKPIVASFVGGASIKGAKSYLRKNGVPAYISPENGVEVLSSSYKYNKMKIKEDNCDYLNSIKKELLKIKENYKDIVKNLLKNPNEYNSKEFLKIHGMNVPRKYLAKTIEEAEDYASKLDNIVMKISSPNIMHKSDAGCVIVKPKDIKEAFNTIMENGKKYLEKNRIKGVIDGVLIEEYIEGLEVIVGGKRDPVFGPVVMVGLGGVFVEVLKDVSFGIYPITKDYALDMLRELKSYKVLEGIRGRPKRDINFIVDIMIRLGVIMDIYPEIKEIDINPLFVKEDGKGGYVGDALIIVGK